MFGVDTQSYRDRVWGALRTEMFQRHGLTFGGCLHWAVAGYRQLRADGFQPLLQAGTALWPYVPASLDDGTSNTHYGFEWDPRSPASLRAVRAGNLPEMHVWLALPETRTIIDFTTWEWSTRAAGGGISWHPDLLPPNYLWTQALPERVVYRPVPEACRLAMYLARKL